MTLLAMALSTADTTDTADTEEVVDAADRADSTPPRCYTHHHTRSKISIMLNIEEYGIATRRSAETSAATAAVGQTSGLAVPIT